MLEYLKDRDQQKAFLAGACCANPTNMKERLAKTQADWDNVGGDKAHVYSEVSFSPNRGWVSVLTIQQESQKHNNVLWAEDKNLQSDVQYLN